MRADERFDVFMSHNGEDKELALDLSERLKQRGLRVWLDVWQLRPGLSWQQGLLDGMGSSDSCAVLIGPAGYGGWHRREIEAALLRQGPSYPVIPVLLPGAPDRGDIDAFLASLTWVDFRAGMDDARGLDRLLWGITGVRPESSLPQYAEDQSRPNRFVITSPHNGDLLIGPSKVYGTGPPNERVFLRYRSPSEDWLHGHSTEVDASGRWELTFRSFNKGPYELYVGGVPTTLQSQPVTIFYQDSTNVHNVLLKTHREADAIQINYEVRTAFLEATKLQTGRVVYSDHIVGPASTIDSIATEAGKSIAEELLKLIPRDTLHVTVSIGAERQVRVQPTSAWVCYYAFPYPILHIEAKVGHDIPKLERIRRTQMPWRMSSRVDRIPKKPFGEDFRATDEYLEVRHEGYRPEFIQLEDATERTVELDLMPVLQKRIAVLDFPATANETKIEGGSQLIAGEIIQALERRPELSTFGYFTDKPHDPPEDILDKIGRPSIIVGNEILSLNDVRLIEKQLNLVDSRMISGEGRFFKRKELDIDLVIRGSYRTFKRP
jgi:TIR domain